jgi:hypothetical protein
MQDKKEEHQVLDRLGDSVKNLKDRLHHEHHHLNELQKK